MISNWDGKIVDNNSTDIGTTVNVTCVEEKRLTTGHLYVYSVCDQHGDWSPAIPDCVGEFVCKHPIATLYT